MRPVRALTRFSLRHPVVVVGLWAIIGVVCWQWVRLITVDTDIANLLPDHNPHVKTSQVLAQRLGGEDYLEVAVSGSAFDTLVATGERFITDALALRDAGRPVFSKAELRNDARVIRDNLLYFMTDGELDAVEAHIRTSVFEAKQAFNPFYVPLGDDDDLDSEADQVLESMLAQVELPPPYFLNADSTVLLLKLYPTGSKSDFGFVERMFADLDSLIAATPYPADVHYGGIYHRHRAKLTDIQDTLTFSVRFGAAAIFLFLVLYILRMAMTSLGTHHWSIYLAWVPTHVAGIVVPLVMSLLITYAIGSALFGVLNIMTTVLIAILLGVNIDYVMHFLSVYLHHRGRHRHNRAVLATIDTTGQALLISSLTSGAAILILLASEFKGFFEFGALFFPGIVSTYILTFSLYAALLTLIHRLFRLRPVNRERVAPVVRWRMRPVFGALMVTAAVATVFAPRIGFEYAFSNLEPDTPDTSTFRRLTDPIDKGYKSDPAYFIFDTREQAVEAFNRIRGGDTTRYRTVRDVESIDARFPTSRADIDRRLGRIAEFRSLMADPVMAEAPPSPWLDLLRRASAQRDPVPLDSVPDFFRNKFTTTDGTLAHLVIIYPDFSLSDGRRSIAFKDDAGTLTLTDGTTWYAASTSIIAAGILMIIQRESVWLMAMPMVATLLLLIVFMRSLTWGLLVFAPLLTAIIVLVGGMAAFGQTFNLYNVIVLPAVLGVGADNGIHLFHRLRDNPATRFADLVSTTGFFITASSVTTILGFIGLMFTGHPGLTSMGMVATVGISLSLLSSLVFAGMWVEWKGER